MITFFSKNILARHTFVALLVISFLVSSIASAALPAICIDQDEAHVVVRDHTQLVSCHGLGFMSADGDVHGTNFLKIKASQNNEPAPCVDIFLSSTETSIPSQQIKKNLSPCQKSAISMVFPSPYSSLSLGKSNALQIKADQLSTFLTSLQTVVLVI